MKKIYEEPMIVVEQYALTQNIAACAVKIGHSDNNCILNDPDAPPAIKDLIFNGTAGEGMDEYDGVCYHTSANNMFTS